MICIGTGPEGKRTLPAPVRLRIDRAESAPADGFEGLFPLPSRCGPLTGLSLWDDGGAKWFDGIVDEQERRLSGEALFLSARSRAALLLDNEAEPQNYVNPSLAVLFERHIRPYGFTGFAGDARTFQGTLTVSKGMSEWAVAAAFCTRFLKTVPRIENGIFDAAGTPPEQTLVFGRGGICFSSAVLKNRFCELFSAVYSRSPGGGSYEASARDREAETLGIARRRYLSGGADAEAVLKRAERKAFEVVLDCPGRVAARLSAPAELPGVSGAEGSGLAVSAVRYLLDNGGEHTQISLRRE